jgi:glycosyltransferase involved in cell wall biosynthesis
MIVKDAEHKLARTLDGVKSFIDEIVIVDTGSADGTVELAKSYGAKIIRFEWTDDFSEARNVALEATTGDWVMWLDAGDVIPPKSIERFVLLKKEPAVISPDSPINAIWGKLNRTVDSQGNVMMSITTPRLVKKSANPKWLFAIHEILYIEEANAVLDESLVIDDPEGPLPKASERNLRIMDKCVAEGKDLVRMAVLRPKELHHLGRYAEAVENIEELYKLELDNNTFADCYVNAGQCFAKLRNEEKEREMFLKALMHNPLNPAPFIYLGDMEFRKENWSRAIPYYRSATDATPEGQQNNYVIEPFYTYAPYEKLAYCYLGLGNDKIALDFLYKAIKVAPKNIGENLKDIVRQLKAQKNTARHIKIGTN